MTMLALIETSANLPGLPIAEAERAADYVRNSRAPGTVRGYRSDCELFQKWSAARGLCHLPATPETCAAYVASLAESGLCVNTISRRVSGIRYGHRLAGLEPPTTSELVKSTLAGVKRVHGAAPKHRKTPILSENAKAMAAAAPAGLKGIRDKAILLFGFASAMRRSEIVALNIEDLTECDDGYTIIIRRSKTDQSGEGQTIAIPRGHGSSCPVRALKAWLGASGITEGAIFRSVRKGGRLRDSRLTAKSVADIVKAYAGRLGLDPATYAGHSLRSGWVTSAARAGANIWRMSDQTRHKSLDVLRSYVRAVELFENHAGAGLL